jgi:nucleoside-diphosphate-sugar epimerase
MSRTVVVFGASSYVGSGVVPRLLADGFDVVAVAHRPSAVRVLLPPPSPRFSVLTALELGSLPADIDIVNLARVRDLLPDSIYRENRRLARSVEEAARGRCRRLIHTSTMAVFGRRLADAAPRRLRWRPIGPYEESKLLAERAMERVAAEQQCELAILRLGNVIGPGSALWVADLAQRIMEREPLLFEGSSGYSNATHVANTSDYISHLLAGEDLRTLPHAPYHHLAEFSARRWSDLLTAMCGAIGHDLVTAPAPGTTATSGEQGKLLLRRIYRRLLGGYLRAGFGLLPDRPLFERLLTRGRSTLTPQAPEPAGEWPFADLALLRLLSTQELFANATVPGWNPPMDFDQACDQIADWLPTAGYSLDPRSRLLR